MSASTQASSSSASMGISLSDPVEFRCMLPSGALSPAGPLQDENPHPNKAGPVSIARVMACFRLDKRKNTSTRWLRRFTNAMHECTVRASARKYQGIHMSIIYFLQTVNWLPCSLVSHLTRIPSEM